MCFAYSVFADLQGARQALATEGGTFRTFRVQNPVQRTMGIVLLRTTSKDSVVFKAPEGCHRPFSVCLERCYQGS